jgi:hypothetical protein
MLLCQAEEADDQMVHGHLDDAFFFFTSITTSSHSLQPNGFAEHSLSMQEYE